LQYQGIVTRPDGKQMRITGMNRARIAGDLVLFNRNYGASTGTNEFGREVKLVDGRVTDISVKGNMTLQANAIVLSGHGANADALATLKKGDKVNVSQTLGNDAADAADAVVGAGPSLLTDGKIDVRTYQEGIASDISYGRSPRTAVGLKADGTMLILVADGRSSSSVGLTLTELAGYLRRLGAVKAVNFDGGGSSEMVVNGRIVNNPSDGGERPVSIALGVFSK
jgi:exopolysaccharide biosynthesis protein